jgi:protein involved in polysaccharide export with SLBB domain
MKSPHSRLRFLAAALALTGFAPAFWLPLRAENVAPNSAPGNLTLAASADADTDDSSSYLNAKDYTLHPTDVIDVDVTDDDHAKRELRIAEDGTVLLAYLDQPIKLSGLTVNQAIAKIEREYVGQKIFIKPQVSLMIAQYAERRITVNGQVNRPGWVEIPPEQEMTLVSVISAAGGPTRLTASSVTITRRMADGQTKVIHANLKAAMEDPRKDIPIEEGDSIYVPESMIGGVF